MSDPWTSLTRQRTESRFFLSIHAHTYIHTHACMHSHTCYLIHYHFISIMTDIFIIADLFLAHRHTCCCLSKRNWRPLSLCGLTYSSSSHVAVRMCGFAIAVLFVVSRYYIRSWFFPQSLCFSPCVVSQPVSGMCFLFACICTGVKTSQLQLQGVGVNSFYNTGCPLRPIVLLWEGVVCIGQSVLSPHRRVCPLDLLTDESGNKEGKIDNVKNVQRDGISDPSPTSIFTFFALLRVSSKFSMLPLCSIFQSTYHRLNRGSFSEFSSVWHHFWVCWCVFSSCCSGGLNMFKQYLSCCSLHVQSEPQMVRNKGSISLCLPFFSLRLNTPSSPPLPPLY